MSRYLSKSVNLIIGGDMSANIVSKSMPTPQSRTLGITMVFTGSPTGTFNVESSNDNTNWIDLPFTEGVIAASGSGDSHALTLKEFPFDFVRVVYTFTSGTGVLNVIVKAKG